jgi:centromere protein C
MAPRGSSIGVSSPVRAASHPAVARRLDFEQDESSLQETPALSGSGQRRGKRANVYDIPDDAEYGSPLPQTSAVLEESFVQEEITANEDSVVISGVAEEDSLAQIGNDTILSEDAIEEMEDAEKTPEPVKQPAKRGRKRKSDVLEPVHEEPPSEAKQRRRGAPSAQASEVQKKGKKAAPVPAVTSRRSKRVSDLSDLEASAVDASVDVSAEPVEDSDSIPAPPKRRGRPARPKPETEKDIPAPAKSTKSTAVSSKGDGAFTKPEKPAAKAKVKPGSKKGKGNTNPADQSPRVTDAESGKFVDVHGHPISKKDMEQMSITSVNSRYGRGRHLSVFRELEPEAVARVGRTGRHRVAPIDFWKNDRISYDPSGSMTSIVKNQDTEPERKKQKTSNAKGKKRNLTIVEEEEVELDPWEEEEGVLVGNFRDYDPTKDVSTNDVVEDSKMRRCDIVQFDYLTISQKLRGHRKVFSLATSQMALSSMQSWLLPEISSIGASSTFAQNR